MEHNTVIAIEANPVIYNTHFLNRTEQAVEMAYKSSSEGVKVNVDLGTIIYNEEDINYLKQVPEYMNHVHISEPGLVLIEKRELHNSLFKLLKVMGYERFVSIEMGNKGDLDSVKGIVKYIHAIAHETN
jgi:sugar phosphate isomerase/epimerase